MDERKRLTYWERLKGKFKRRWGDVNKHWGPFTLSPRDNKSQWKPYGFIISSGSDEDYPHLRFYLGPLTILVEIPLIFQPFKIRHFPTTWNEETIKRIGRNWYDEVFPVEYGLSFYETDIHFHYGPQTMDSSTTKSKVWFYPWKESYQVYYGLIDQGGHTFWKQQNVEKKLCFVSYDERRAILEQFKPYVYFQIQDYDRKIILARTYMQEEMWKTGKGIFKWLLYFKKARHSKTLDIEFQNEVGPEKGSWKGGLMGLSVKVLPGELHEDTFRRFCQEYSKEKKYYKYPIFYDGLYKDQLYPGAFRN